MFVLKIPTRRSSSSAETAKVSGPWRAVDAKHFLPDVDADAKLSLVDDAATASVFWRGGEANPSLLGVADPPGARLRLQLDGKGVILLPGPPGARDRRCRVEGGDLRDAPRPTSSCRRGGIRALPASRGI